MPNFVLSEVFDSFASSKNFQRTLETIGRGESVVWDGCVGSSYALLGGALSNATRRPILVVVSTISDVERVAADLEFFCDAPILTYPMLSNSSIESSDDVIVSDDLDFGKRLFVLKSFDECAGDSLVQSERLKTSKKAPVIVSSLRAMVQPVPSKEQILDDSICLKLNCEYGRDRLIRWLLEGKYVSTTAVELPGEYSVRGDVVDVFATDWERPIRIEFFGDMIDSIRQFDTVDQRSTGALESVVISRLQASGQFSSRFTDRLPNDAITLILDTERVVSETSQLLSGQDHDANASSVAEIMNALYRRPTVHAVAVASGIELANLTISAPFSSVDHLRGALTRLEKSFGELAENERVVVGCGSDGEARRLEATLENSAPAFKDRIIFCVGSINDGFGWSEAALSFIGSDQLLGRVLTRRMARAKRKKVLRRNVDSFLELSPKDYVVHEDYGVARYWGIETIKKANQTEDHLKLEFADGVFVYVPASKIHKIQRYVGVGGRKARLSVYKGKAWNAKKNEAKKAIWGYAREMLELQASRDLLRGVAFPPDGEWQRDFESLFPYCETDDQLTAIEAVKKDMERTRPMDRLLCGDVGFGKTEIALRASFKAFEAGYQVAVLAPTTALVEQHFRTFQERTAPFHARVGTLSRYSSPKEQRETLAKLVDGSLDIVIGTHRLLSKDVSFKNLGLIVIDEEQKFGVAHKEKLKSLRSTVDVLTMTATPIPRTLHFSLLGLRDVSNLETPPEGRLPVETKVLRFNDNIIRQATLRELNRGGQIYYLHNRIFDIENVVEKIKALVPEARIRSGHAQMPPEALEETMRDFVLKKFDMLVCTTIVESGLDIPNANTIFIDNADQFGLAELHQLRGRVGREKRQAYCYLLVNPSKTPSSQSIQRLNALQEYNKLGSGFQIAMRDLEIRGAGNILGTQQSGHLEAIGYEMYCDMLEAATRALRNEPQKIRVDVEIDLPVSATLDSHYVRDSKAKIDFYRRFDRASSLREVDLLLEELADRFGKPPKESERVYTLAKIRILAFEIRVKKIQLVEIISHFKTLEIEFRDPAKKICFRELLAQRGISLRFIDEEPKGYIELPRDLFYPNGVPKSDELLEYVLGLFTFSAKERDTYNLGEPLRTFEPREVLRAEKDDLRARYPTTLRDRMRSFKKGKAQSGK